MGAGLFNVGQRRYRPTGATVRKLGNQSGYSDLKKHFSAPLAGFAPPRFALPEGQGV
jgi:hypothetical protein